MNVNFLICFCVALGVSAALLNQSDMRTTQEAFPETQLLNVEAADSQQITNVSFVVTAPVPFATSDCTNCHNTAQMILIMEEHWDVIDPDREKDFPGGFPGVDTYEDAIELLKKMAIEENGK